MTGTEQLKQWIEASDNIVFFGGAVCQRKAEFRIFEVWTGYIIRNMIIRRRRFSVTPSIWKRQKNFINFTGIKCWLWMQNRMHTSETGRTGSKGQVKSGGDTEY